LHGGRESDHLLGSIISLNRCIAGEIAMPFNRRFPGIGAAASNAVIPAIALLFASMLAVSNSPAQTPNALNAADEAAIRATVTAVPEALNHKDMKAYADLFFDDADWINVVGMHWRGKAAIVKAHTIYLKTLFSKGGMSTAELSVRAVAPDVAIAVVTEKDNGGVLPDGSSAPPGLGRLTYVLAKRGGKWKIVHGHNTGINLEAQRFDPINGNQ
jgi:uncharacterized protein (TIGR02246 family)